MRVSVQSKPSGKLPPVIHAVRRISRRQIAALVEDLFNNTDDTLFELADRSDRDVQQIMYFDSMRTIRLKRAEIIQSFLDALDDQFLTAFSVHDTAGIASGQPEEQEYRLLEQDEMELSVAISGIVSKITSQFSLPIMELTKRFSALAPGGSIVERNNPLGPYALSTAFAQALQALQVNIKIRIIIMKMFERFVMERLGPTIDAVNRELIQAGVLPDIDSRQTTAKRRAERANTAEPRRAPAGSRNRANDRGVALEFETIQTLLAQARSEQEGASAMLSSLNSDTPVNGGSGPGVGEMPSAEVLHLLNEFQQAHQANTIDLAVRPVRVDLAEMIAGSGPKRSLTQADDDTINFVGMLFDFILDDHNLALPMKALLARLQIPLVKVALLDRGFFNKPSHPARMLLNELSSAGVGWSLKEGLERDGVYEKIESTVVAVANEFTDNPNVFADLLQDFRSFVSQENRRSMLVEQRVRETESGKAKTREAKLRVQDLINEQASGLSLPTAAGRFVSQHWSKVMTVRYVREGETGTGWKRSVATLEQLLWMLQPTQKHETISKRVKATTELVSDIEAGMSETGCAKETIDEFTAWLKDYLQKLSRSDLDHLESAQTGGFDEAVEPLAEIILEQPDSDQDTDLPDTVVRDLDRLCEGVWLEFRLGQDTPERAKLATMTQPGLHYVFVNRRGMKVLALQRLELGKMLAEGTAVILEEAEVFERALQSVIANLRQTRGRHTSTG